MNLIEKIYQKWKLKRDIQNDWELEILAEGKVKKQLVQEDFEFLNQQSEEVLKFLFSHWDYYYHNDKNEDIENLLRSVYLLKKKIIENSKEDERTNILNYDKRLEGKRKEISLEKSYMDTWVLLYEPEFLPLVENDAFDCFLPTFNLSKEGNPAFSEILFEALDNLNERRQNKILALLHKNQLNVHQIGFSDFLTYSDLELDTYRNFVMDKQDTTTAQLFFATLYQKLGCRIDNLSILRNFKYGTDSFYRTMIEEYLSEEAEVDFSSLTEIDLGIMDAYLKEKEETAKERALFLMSPHFKEASDWMKMFMLQTLTGVDQKDLFSETVNALSKEGLEGALTQAFPRHLFYASYLNTQDLDTLKEREALWTVPFFQRQIDSQLEMMEFIETAGSKELELERRRLVQLNGMMEDEYAPLLLNRMRDVHDVKRAIQFVGQVAFSLLPEENERLRESVFASLPGDRKEITLDDGLTIEIPDYTYVKQQAALDPITLENQKNAKVLILYKKS